MNTKIETHINLKLHGYKILHEYEIYMNMKTT